ncbi:MAG: PD-(D/E)XK nuclease family transposase, partial [Bacteroidales bacterium]|nr:PD-(D/E)XK nuclease family transposase [Bacteroidales bacterium]
AETIVIIFVEMAHFNKRIEDCVTDLDKMLYLLKFIGKMMEQPAWLQNEVYTRIFNACEIAGFPEDKRIKYEQEMNDEKRLRSEYNTAKRMGLEEGLMKGREEGQQSKAIEIALKLMANGMSPSEAAEFVGISEDLLPQ